MALGHNVIIHGLNSIYKHAPYIGPQEAVDFVAYRKCWHDVLGAHHRMEEIAPFPAIEEKTGIKGYHGSECRATWYVNLLSGYINQIVQML